jgi:hypothetical protein
MLLTVLTNSDHGDGDSFAQLNPIRETRKSKLENGNWKLPGLTSDFLVVVLPVSIF